MENKNLVYNDQCDVTFQDLLGWYEAVFEKYGWILLMSKKNKDSTKIREYLNGVKKLYDKLCCYKHQTINIDKKRDIQVMKKNLYLIFGEFLEIKL
jgi:hypothetical protein